MFCFYLYPSVVVLPEHFMVLLNNVLEDEKLAFFIVCLLKKIHRFRSCFGVNWDLLHVPSLNISSLFSFCFGRFSGQSQTF